MFKSSANFTLILFLASAASVLASEKVINARQDQVTNPIQLGEVVFLDSDLNRTKTIRGLSSNISNSVIRISAERTNLAELPSGYKRISVLFRNHTDYDYVIEARAQFYNDFFEVTENYSKWQRVYLSPNSLQSYSENSISFDTTKYRVEVRQAK